MLCKVTSVWTVMSHFIRLLCRWNATAVTILHWRKQNPVGSIFTSLNTVCCVWHHVFCTCGSLRLFTPESDGVRIKFIMQTATQNKKIKSEFSMKTCSVNVAKVTQEGLFQCELFDVVLALNMTCITHLCINTPVHETNRFPWQQEPDNPIKQHDDKKTWRHHGVLTSRVQS